MNIKRLIMFCLAVILAIGNSACSSTKEKTMLKVYFMDHLRNCVEAVTQFNEKYKDVSIEKKVFFNGEEEKFGKQLSEGFASGGEPDIAIFRPESIQELSKYISNGVFTDLNELINNDKEFKLSDYNEKVLNCGVYKGKRYFIPLSYNVQALCTTKELLESNKLNIDEANWDWSNVSELIKSYMDQNLGKDRYFFGSSVGFKSILDNSGVKYVDMEKREAKFNTPEFIDILNTYRNIYNAIYPREKIQNLTMDAINAQLKNGSIVMQGTFAGALRNVWMPYSAFNSEVSPQMYSLPAYKGKKHIVAYPSELVAINSKCKDKKAALNYVKMLLSTEMQSNEYNYNAPVNKKAFDLIKEECLKSEKSNKSSLQTRGGGCSTDASIQKLIKDMDNIISNIEYSMIIDDKIDEMIKIEVKELVKGNRSADDVANLLQQKVEEYFKDNTLPKVQVSNRQEGEKKGELKIYLYNFDREFSYAINKFNETHNDISIKEETFTYDQNKPGEFEKKLSTELLAGEGPDIVRCSSSLFPSMRKALSSGVFCDLNELIANDREFNLLDYNEKIMESGVYKGKRYLIPIEYYFPILYTSKGVLDKNSIKIDNYNWSLKQLTEVIKKYKAEHPEKDKYFLGWNIFFDNILRSTGDSFVDFDNKKSNFNSPKFIEILNMYKEIYPTICPYEIIEKYNDPFVMLQSNVIIMGDTGLNSQSDLKYRRERIGEDMLTYIYPTSDGKFATYPNTYRYLAINAKCKYKKEAFDYIKIMLSEEIQKDNLFHSFPVNKKAYEASKNKEPGDTKEDAEFIDKVVNSIEKCELLEVKLSGIVNRAVDDFVKGKKSAEETAKIIDNEVTIFLNE